jgi:excisionase family DNA binding protein
MTRQSAPAGYLMPNEVADILHVSMKTVSRWAREGKLPYSRTLGGHRRYEEQAIRDLLAANTIPAENGRR